MEHVPKIGTWGGNGGTPQDITKTPKRLESITIKSGEVIDSIAFSYIDQAGQKQTAGPWGGSGGSPHTIKLAASEVVKEISGTYAPVPVQSGSQIAGFFARGGVHLEAIGVYVSRV